MERESGLMRFAHSYLKILSDLKLEGSTVFLVLTSYKEPEALIT